MLKKIWSRIKLEHVAIVILVLLVWVKGRWKMPDPQIVTQTHIIEHFHDSVIYRDSFHTLTIKEKIPVQLQPSSNDSILREQYNQLVQNYSNTSVVNDTLKIDTLGTVSLTDSIRFNSLKNRRYTYNLKEKETITTITIKEPYKIKNQFYYGGELGYVQGATSSISSASAGIMFKNKRDNAIKLSGGYNFPLKSVEFRIGYYQKLHF